MRIQDINEHKQKVQELKDEGSKKALKALPKVKPYLAVMPATLISQWVAELRKFSDVFHIYIYHGDYRMKEKQLRNVYRIGAPLTKSHHLVKGNETEAASIIITTYQTLAARH